MRSPALLALLCAALPACSSGAPAKPPSPDAGAPTGPFFLRDPQGRALLLRGVNLAGAHKNKPYFGFHTLPDFQRVRQAWGMNTLRFLISWAAVEPEEGVYDASYLDQVALRMDWARQSGLYVVLDMHQDIYGEGFGGDGAPRWTCDAAAYAAFKPQASWFLDYLDPNVSGCYDHFWGSASLQGHYAEAWRRVAARLIGYDGVILGFDVMNEPYWGSQSTNLFEAQTLQPFYEKVVASVRSAQPGWTAFLEPAASRNLDIPTGLTTMSFPNVVYSPHSYDSSAEQGQGFDPSQRDFVIVNDQNLRAEATAMNASLWIGEYGGVPTGAGFVAYLTAELDAQAKVTTGATIWSYDKGGYGMLRQDGSETEPTVDLVVRPWAEHVAGDPLAMSYDAATATFTLTYTPNPSITAPTEVSVPARHYPKGYTVDCGGCTTARSGGVLQLLTPAAGTPATVVIRPAP